MLFTQKLTFASEYFISPNFDEWNYENAIEVNINTDYPNAKIFYYTDWVWEMIDQKEYKGDNPIIIKDDTQLNYYAIYWENESTLMQEKNYKINYPNSLKFENNNEKLFLKNTGSKPINLYLRKIESTIFSFTYDKETLINPGESILINENVATWEEFRAISPNNKVNISFVIQEKKETSTSENIRSLQNNKKNEIPLQKKLDKAENEFIIPEKKESLTSDNNPSIQNNNKNVGNEYFHSENKDNLIKENIVSQEKEDLTKKEIGNLISPNDQIKASVIDKQNWSSMPKILLLVLILMWVAWINVYNFIKNKKS